MSIPLSAMSLKICCKSRKRFKNTQLQCKSPSTHPLLTGQSMSSVFCRGQTWLFLLWLSAYSSHIVNSFSADPVSMNYGSVISECDGRVSCISHAHVPGSTVFPATYIISGFKSVSTSLLSGLSMHLCISDICHCVPYMGSTQQMTKYSLLLYTNIHVHVHVH